MPYIGNIVQDFSVNTAMLNTDSVTSIKIDDGTIVNADINDSAAIAGTKISPNFGSQNIATTGNVSIGGTNLNMSTAYIDFSGSISTPSTAAAIYRPADNQLAFSTANTERVKITNSGLDVTGAITGTGDLTIDTSTLKVDSSNNRVGIGTTSVDRRFHVEGTDNVMGKFQNDQSICLIEFEDTDTTAGNRPSFGSDANNSVIYTGGSEKFRVDSSGNVGIGTISPRSITGYKGLTLNHATNGGFIQFQEDGTNNSHILGGPNSLDVSTQTSIPIYLKTAGDNIRMTIASGGDVGIGTTSPDTLLHLAGADTAIIRLENTDTSLGSSQLIGAIEFEKQDPTGAGVGIAGAIRLKSMSSVGQAASMFFATSNSSGNDQTRMTIDFDGRVLIGGASSINASTNADDLQVGASTQSNQTGITLGSTVASSLRFMDAANDSAGYIQMNHGTDELTIKSNSGGIIFNVGGEVATLDSTGLKLVSGKGINFHNYGSGTDVNSNLLDDYEEGTFSWSSNSTSSGWPTNFTVGNQNNSYTKIGNLVTLKGGFTIGNASGTVAQGNYFDFDDSSLPFTVINKGAGTETVQTVGRFWIYQVLGGNVNASGDVILVHGGYLRFFVTFTTSPNRTNTGGITFFINYTSSQ